MSIQHKLLQLGVTMSIYVKRVLFDIASDLPSRIKNTQHMFDITVELNNSKLQ